MSKKIKREFINGVEHKECSNCGKFFPITKEYFHKQKCSPDGYRSTCKSCRKLLENETMRIRANQYYQQNSETILCKWREKYANDEVFKKSKNDSRKRYYVSNHEKVLADRAVYRENNRQMLRDKAKEYRETHSEQIAETKKRIYQTNKEHYQSYKKDYGQTEHGSEMIAVANQRRKANKRKVKDTFSKQDWLDCKAYFNNSCCYCGKPSKKLHQEHFIPLSKGGEYVKENMLPACSFCNLSKHDKDFYEWYPKQEFYSEDRLKKISDYISLT